MIIKALQARFEAGNPVKVGMIGAGFMGRGCQSNYQLGAGDGTGGDL